MNCPECGANKIRESVSLCEVCEISQRYETRLEQLQGLLDLAKTMRDVAAKEREEWEATAEKAAAARVERKAVKKRLADLRKELTELKRKLKTEEDFTASYIRRLHEAEKTIEILRAELELAHKFHDVAVKERDLARRQLDRPHEPPGRTEYVVGLERNLDQMRQCIEGFVEVVEAAEAHATGPKGGQQVTFSGDFASVPPSTRGQLRWWARRLKEASNEHSSESYRPS